MKRLETGPYKGTAYEVIGQGSPVMLIHGFPLDHSLWEKQRTALSKDHKLLLPDLPGTGKSPLPNPLGMEEMAASLREILLQEKIEKCVLIGHSMGGYVALAFAEKYPELLSGLGLFHSTAYADNETKKNGRRKAIKMIEEYGPERFLRNMIPNLYPVSLHKERKKEMEHLLKKRMEAGLEALIPYYKAMLHRPDRTAVLKQARFPVLFVMGEKDVVIPKKSILELSRLPRIAMIHLLKDTGHLGMLDKPEESNQILRHFVALCEAECS